MSEKFYRDMIEEEKINFYDDIVGRIMVNLYTLGKKANNFTFLKYDHKNVEHRLVLAVARQMSWLGWNIYLDAKPTVVHKIQKTTACQRIKNPKDGIDVEELLTFMKKEWLMNVEVDIPFKELTCLKDAYNEFFKETFK